MLISICADGLLMKFALCNTVLSALAEDARAGRVGCIWLVIHPVLQSSNSAIETCISLVCARWLLICKGLRHRFGPRVSSGWMELQFPSFLAQHEQRLGSELRKLVDLVYPEVLYRIPCGRAALVLGALRRSRPCCLAAGGGEMSG